MQTEAILLSLFGLISYAISAPPLLKAPELSAAVLDTSQTAQRGHLERLLGYCEREPMDAGCLAYKEIINIVERSKASDIEQKIDKELAQNVSKTEANDFCVNLSQMLKQLPKNRNLESFKRIPDCVRICYSGSVDPELKDSCRALLYVGSAVISQSNGNEEVKHQHQPEPVVAEHNGAIAVNSHSAVAEIVPAAVAVSNLDKNKSKPNIQISATNGTEKVTKKLDPAQQASDGTVEGKKSEGGELYAGPVSQVAKQQEVVPDQPAPPVQPPEESIVPQKGDDGDEPDHLLQQNGLDGHGGDTAPFDDEPKQPNEQDGKGATQPQYENSDESEGMSSMEDVNDKVDDPEGIQSHGNFPVVPSPKETPSDAATSSLKPIAKKPDPFFNQKDSNFFSYFLFVMFSCAILYIAYHNKSKVLALVVEGRRTSSGRGGFSKGRKHTAAYRKLDSNLEEAITSGSASGGHSSSQIIY